MVCAECTIEQSLFDDDGYNEFASVCFLVDENKTDKIITMLRRKSLAQNVAVEAKRATHTRQEIFTKQGSYNFMR